MVRHAAKLSPSDVFSCGNQPLPEPDALEVECRVRRTSSLCSLQVLQGAPRLVPAAAQHRQAQGVEHLSLASFSRPS